ncbi:MAG: SDR family oxidoreductase [Bacteriovoracaceae bacterium]
MIELKGKVAVITGGSAGVGRALARAFAAKGMKVALLARGKEKLEATVDELELLGAEVRAYPTDVARMEEVEEAAAKIERELGPIHLWINDAMVSVFSPIKDTSAEEIRRTTEVTYLGSVHGILVALRYMSPRNEGQILQIGSALAYQSIPLQAAYCAAKQAVRGFLQSLRMELKHDRSSVMVTELHLPAVNTPQFEWLDNHLGKHPMPVPPIFQPEVVAKAAVYLAEHPKREMWLAGSTVKAIIASKLAPRIAEWYLAKNGFNSQLTDELKAKKDSDLWKPVPKDYGAHGSFDKEARRRSYLLDLRIHGKDLLLGSVGLAALAGLFMGKSSRPRALPTH